MGALAIGLSVLVLIAGLNVADTPLNAHLVVAGVLVAGIATVELTVR
jgi:hypothetical protein